MPLVRSKQTQRSYSYLAAQRSIEFSAFQILEEVNILFEGWKDKRLFEVAISGRFDEARELARLVKSVGFCHAQGVKDVAKVSSLLEMAKRKWIVISDGDKPAREHQQRYTWPGRWYRYDELASADGILTSEDFLDDKKVKNTLAKVCKRHSVDLSVEVVIPDTGKLAAIEKMLKQSGHSGDVVRCVVDDLKDELIESVKPGDLRDVYFSVMRAAVETLLGVCDDSTDSATVTM